MQVILRAFIVKNKKNVSKKTFLFNLALQSFEIEMRETSSEFHRNANDVILSTFITNIEIADTFSIIP